MDNHAADSAVQQELLAREPIFHRERPGSDRSVFEAMTARDFWEVGASGRRYSRDYVLDTVAQRYTIEHEDPWEINEFQVRHLAGEVFLVTYLLVQRDRLSRRSTIWAQHDGRWRASYHQGTLVHSGDP